MPDRFNSVSCMVGRPGTGKTHLARQIEKQYHKKGMRVIVIDDFDHPSWRDLPIVDPSKIKSVKHRSFRLIDAEIEENIFPVLSNNTWNALVIFEDCYKYVGHKFSRPLSRLVIDAKQRNLDFIFMYHYFGWIPLDMARRADAFIMFKTNDTPATRFKDFPALGDMMKKFNEAQQDPSPFAHRLYKTGLNG